MRMKEVEGGLGRRTASADALHWQPESTCLRSSERPGCECVRGPGKKERHKLELQIPKRHKSRRPHRDVRPGGGRARKRRAGESGGSCRVPRRWRQSPARPGPFCRHLRSPHWAHPEEHARREARVTRAAPATFPLRPFATGPARAPGHCVLE